MKNQRAYAILLCAVLFLVSTIAGIWIMPSLSDATGTVHPDYPSMLHSGTSVTSTSTTKWIVTLYGAAIICMFTSVIFIATRKKDSSHQSKLWLRVAIGGVLYLVVYGLMVRSAAAYSATGVADYFLGFPAPTAWMLFGMWTIPLFFTFFYVFRFDDWVISPEEEEKFNAIIAKRNQAQ